MRKAVWYLLAAAGVAAVSYFVVTTSANADGPTPDKFAVTIEPLPSGGPTAPAHDLPGVDDELNKLPGPVVAAPELDGPTITQSPTELP